MNKPEKKTFTNYDYYDCIAFIKEKYGYDPEDVTGRCLEYRNIWNWITDRVEIHNGCFFWLSEDMTDYKGCPPWVKKVVNDILNEFGDGKREVELYVSW